MIHPANRMKTLAGSSMNRYGLVRELMRKGVDIVNLDAGRPSFDTPLHIKEASKAALDQGVVHYGDLQGSLRLREALVKKLKNYNKIDVESNEVLITNGLTQASFSSLMAYLNEGDEVILFEPFYPQHIKKIELLGGKPVPVILKHEDGYKFDPKEVERKITSKTRIIVLVNPVNPTGRVFSYEEISALADITIKNDLLLITDEVYEYTLYDGHKHISIASLPEMRERTISLYGFTKTYAMDGWRLGYVVAKDEILDNIKKIALQETAHPNVFAQDGAVAATEGPQDCVREMVSEYNRRRELLCKRLNAIPNISCKKPEGAMYAFPDFTAMNKSSNEIADELLKEAKVATNPGILFGPSCEGFLRLCFASTSYERIEEAMNRIESHIKHSK